MYSKPNFRDKNKTVYFFETSKTNTSFFEIFVSKPRSALVETKTDTDTKKKWRN